MEKWVVVEESDQTRALYEHMPIASQRRSVYLIGSGTTKRIESGTAVIPLSHTEKAANN